jgi:hypothetical protein
VVVVVGEVLTRNNEAVVGFGSYELLPVLLGERHIVEAGDHFF